MTVSKIKVEEIDKLAPLFQARDNAAFTRERVERINAGGCDIYVLEDGGRLVGEVTIIYDEREYEGYTIPGRRVFVQALRVLPECCGRGLGQYLMREVMRRVKNEGYAEMMIGVEDNNVAARHIYGKLGFIEFVKRDKGRFEQDSFEYDVFLCRLLN